MFEKEAEERITEQFGTSGEYVTRQRIWQDGAAFGYNKANEWHFVKDGKCPAHSYRVLVFTDEGVGFGIYGLDDKKWHTYDTGFEVIAWKEIILPEEKEQ